MRGRKGKWTVSTKDNKVLETYTTRGNAERDLPKLRKRTKKLTETLFIQRHD
jgi:hypothetical protein